MGIALIIVFAVILIVLFLAVKWGWISKEDWEILVGIAAIISALAALAVFLIPPARSTESNSDINPPSSLTIQPVHSVDTTPINTPGNENNSLASPTITKDISLEENSDIVAVSEVEVTQPVNITPQNSEEDFLTTPSGLRYFVIEEGDGKPPQIGDVVQVHYIMKLEDGTQIDNSYARGEPFSFVLGTEEVIPGLDEGIALLKTGSKAILIIPPEIAYGQNGIGNIPSNSTLIIEVELVGFQTRNIGNLPEINESEFIVTPTGLKYFDFEVGNGTSPRPGQTLIIHYTIWLKDGTLLDSSFSNDKSFEFVHGEGQVILGLDEGVSSMRVGGTRLIIVPPDLAYGASGIGSIPPNTSLVIEVELLDIQ